MSSQDPPELFKVKMRADDFMLDTPNDVNTHVEAPDLTCVKDMRCLRNWLKGQGVVCARNMY